MAVQRSLVFTEYTRAVVPVHERVKYLLAIDKIMHRLREKEHQPKLRMNDVQTKPIPGGSMKV